MGKGNSSNALAVESGQNPRNKRDNRRAKNARYCDHCQRTSHTQDQYFKIIGYPDWYDGPREASKGKKISRVAANVTSQTEQLPDSPLDDSEVPKTLGQTDHTLVQALAQEMMKIMKMKGNAEHQHSFAHFAGIAGSNSYSNISCAVQSSHHGSWIVDTGASDHMTYNLHFFTKLQPLSNPIHITLPDGSIKTVSQAGQIVLCPKLTLHNVLYVLDFKFNLISVNKLLTDLHLFALFTPETCIFQDPSTNQPVAIAPVDNGLYQFQFVDQASLDNTLQPSSKTEQNKSSASLTAANPSSIFTSSSSDCKNPGLDIIHARLGHTSSSKMQHLPLCIQHLSKTFAYEVCIQAKMHRLPFKKNTITTSTPFQLIHLDL